MKINKNSTIPAVKMEMDGAKDVTMKVLIGPKDGSQNIIMRYFRIFPGGHTPLHEHNFEHIIKVEKGNGLAIDENGKEHKITEGQSIFVESNKRHQFRNNSSEPFEFTCAILNQEAISYPLSPSPCPQKP
ncbi:MAG: cupin domain-containing protein [Candidatus Gracilibacteria bacterium]|jgi:quercetin dioxygenase-like cupin family protein